MDICMKEGWLIGRSYHVVMVAFSRFFLAKLLVVYVTQVVLQALIENPNLPNELRNVIYNIYLPSYNMAAKTDGDSTEAFSHCLLEAHSDLSRVLYQQPTPLCKYCWLLINLYESTWVVEWFFSLRYNIHCCGISIDQYNLLIIFSKPASMTRNV